MSKHLKEVTIDEKLSIVIRRWNKVTPYVVHYLGQGGDYYDGFYCQTYEQAMKELMERVSSKIKQGGEE